MARARPKRQRPFDGHSRRWRGRSRARRSNATAIASTSHPGVDYVITADGADVACSCPGFEYRGQCRHARDVKAALAAGKPAPAGYRGA